MYGLILFMVDTGSDKNGSRLTLVVYPLLYAYFSALTRSSNKGALGSHNFKIVLSSDPIVKRNVSLVL